jgi:FkbM family methyltransferase
LIQHLPLTRIKLGVARVLYWGVRVVMRGDRHRIRRGGIRYDVDLSEGIDLSLFLFGRFQSHVLEQARHRLDRSAVIFDVGANFGSMTLPLARVVPDGKVYAFEPTEYAFRKLERNVTLNPELADRIVLVRSFLSDSADPDHGMHAYSSWKVDRWHSTAHPLHGGLLKDAGSVGATTIDAFCAADEVTRVDFIKIDTDGYEYRVLRGGRQTIGRHRPILVFELAQYVMEEHGITFDTYHDYFSPMGYRLISCRNGRIVTPRNHRREIPSRATVDLLALP